MNFSIYQFDELTLQQAKQLCLAQYNYWFIKLLTASSNEIDSLLEDAEFDFLSENDVSEKVNIDDVEEIEELRSSFLLSLKIDRDKKLSLSDFISKKFKDKKSFALAINKSPQYITKMIVRGDVVIAGDIYSKRKISF